MLGTEYFKHGIYSPFFSLQNAVCFILLTYVVPALFTFYIQGVLKLKKNNSGAKRLIVCDKTHLVHMCICLLCGASPFKSDTDRTIAMLSLNVLTTCQLLTD